MYLNGPLLINVKRRVEDWPNFLWPSQTIWTLITYLPLFLLTNDLLQLGRFSWNLSWPLFLACCWDYFWCFGLYLTGYGLIYNNVHISTNPTILVQCLVCYSTWAATHDEDSKRTTYFRLSNVYVHNILKMHELQVSKCNFPFVKRDFSVFSGTLWYSKANTK